MKHFFNLRLAFLSALVCMGMSAFAQITGTVVDASNGEPVIGATVLEVGTSNGTITDWDGNFVLNVAPGTKLAISYVGYKALEIAAANNLKVVLHEDSEVLDEVVVVGYGVVKKGDATGSVTAIKPDDMNKGLTTNAQDMLQGKIAGVNVVASDGTPGGAASIVIRGGASLNASNSPLIVIDGLPMDNNGIQGVANPLSMVNPSDIETFTVLKDASATAIYGSRASNGVIIITTKKGAKGSKPVVNYNGNVSFGTLTNRLETLSGDELRAYASGLGHSADAMATLGTENTNWQDQIFRTAISTDHNISVMGGVKTKHCDMPYRASIGYTLNNGTLKTSQMQRVTASLNLSPSFLDDHLNFNINTKGMYIYNRFAPNPVGAALSMDPTMPVYGGATNAAGEVLASDFDIENYFGGYYQRTKTPSGYGDDEWPVTKNAQTTANPLATIEQTDDRANAGSFVGNIEADYKIHGFEDLRLHASFGADYSYGLQKKHQPRSSYDGHYYGYDERKEKSKYNLQFSAYAQYYKDFTEDHHFDVMVGYESQYFYNEFHEHRFGTYPMTNSDPALAGTLHDEYKFDESKDLAMTSVYGRINWNGWNQLLVTVNFRADASSRFAKKDSHGKNARWGLFPSVALGWKIKETLLKDVNAVNDLKLRVGYGVTGQQDLGDKSEMYYYYLAKYVWARDHAYYPVLEGGESNPLYQGTDANGNDVYMSSRPDVYNADLTWEKTYSSNIGIDFAFLNNRITGNIDYYHRRTRDLLSDLNVAAGSNFKNMMKGNIGSLYNQGVEFAINAVLVDIKNFKWDLGYNVAWNQNKITKLLSDDENYFVPTGGISSGKDNMIQAHKVGYAANSFYVYETRKISLDDGTVRYAVVDRNSDGQIGPDDKYMYHSPVAPVTMGLQTKFQFYGFDLGITLRSSIGNYVYNDVLSGNLQWVEGSKVYQNQNGGYHGVLRNAFNTYYDGNMRSDNMYGISKDGEVIGTFSDWFLSDYFVENASFLRIDNITLGYSFAPKTSKLSGRVYCTVSNPCVFTNYKGLDPEVGGGIDNNIYPRSMTTVLGVSLQF